jgi:diguanylate cyclase (GGDEF)-like protein
MSLVLALVDVDGLKATNDRLGHAAGDVLLRDVAMAITTTMRAYDVAVRWGGDEFVCALSDMTLEVATERVATIRRALDEHGSGASVSVGLTQTDGHDSLEALVARADAAMYHAKEQRSEP